jgi:5-methylcytosine-specific restriction endonuclease McrA
MNLEAKVNAYLTKVKQYQRKDVKYHDLKFAQLLSKYRDLWDNSLIERMIWEEKLPQKSLATLFFDNKLKLLKEYVKDNPHYIKCMNCGEPFEVDLSDRNAPHKSTICSKCTHEWYETYLSSDKWKQKRKEVLSRDGDKCRMCGTTEHLEVHHLHYRDFGNENLNTLLTLCTNCHEFVHTN